MIYDAGWESGKEAIKQLSNRQDELSRLCLFPWIESGPINWNWYKSSLGLLLWIPVEGQDSEIVKIYAAVTVDVFGEQDLFDEPHVKDL